MKPTHIYAVSAIVACAGLALPVMEYQHSRKDTLILDQVDMNWRPADSSIVMPPPPSTFPSILVKKNENDTSSVPLRLSSLEMNVKVTGNIATTTMTLTFYNDVDRELEGQLVFPLGEGQSVSFFALEVNGEFREASVVEKSEGRRVFENVVRRRIDPGLLEWTKGNNFRARIFPIPAHGYKKIMIAYDQELINTGRSFIYMQPMLFTDALEHFSLRCEVVNAAQAPIVPDPLLKDERQSLEFREWQNAWVAEFNAANFIAGKDIVFEVPMPPGLQQAFAEPAGGDSSYFWLALTPPPSQREKKLPSSLALFWDKSTSADSSDAKKTMEVLDAYFRKIGDFDLQLVLFSNEIVYEKRFRISGGDWSAVIRKISDTPNDGGTQLGCLDLSRYKAEEGILVSDALANFGKKEFDPPAYPLVAITASRSADHSFLKYAARASNGQFINLFAKTREEGVYDLLHQPFRFISAVPDDGNVCSTWPSVPSDFSRTFTLSGMLKGGEGTVTLNFGYGNEITHSRKVTVKSSPAVSNGLVKRAWAMKKINELDLRFEKNKAEITALGKAFGIVTRNTSLLVLDRLEDYVQYKIRPKDAKMREQYDMLVKNERKLDDSLSKEHIELVIKQFEERKEWYAKDFTSDRMKYREERRRLDSLSHGLNPHAPPADEIETVTDSMVMTHDLNPTVQFNSNATLNGTAGVTYSWDFSSPAPGAFSFSPGAFTVTLTDANGCVERNIMMEDGSSKVNMKVKEWDPETPYIQKLKKTSADKLYETYLALKKKHYASPSFYLDVANYFWKKGEGGMALRILSNIAELQLEDASVLRILAHKLKQMKKHDLALEAFSDVLKIRDEEPQSYRDLALCLSEMGRDQEAVDLLCRVINRNWDGRFPGIELICTGEVNEIISTSSGKLNLDSLDKRLIHSMPMDVRIVITWDTDASDMDLWVTDPDGFVCSYRSKDTPSGGHLSNDFTGGYGPEEFILRHAVPGPFLIQVNFFGDSRTTLSGPVTVQAELFTNYGKRNAKKETLTLRLEEAKDVYDIGELVFGGAN